MKFKEGQMVKAIYDTPYKIKKDPKQTLPKGSVGRIKQVHHHINSYIVEFDPATLTMGEHLVEEA